MLHSAHGRAAPALLTDLYQVTMLYAYWKSGADQKEAVFHLFFRSQPFSGGFSIACGLSEAIDYLGGLCFQPEELAYLATLAGNDGQPLFEPAFLRCLQEMEWSCDVDAVPEGTVVFPHEPLLRIKGPIMQCQLVESALLNQLNFHTLIATKAARICLAAKGDPVIEFGLRRAQGSDGALSASRASYIGGCAATSNLLAGQLFGIPVRGTHAHSWVMSFETEEEAFKAYAEAMPNNAVFLVDTYNTLQGVSLAIEQGHALRAKGYKLAGIRLDSGDLAYLSIQARRMLDSAGFGDAHILASNDLDEHTITSLKGQGAAIDIWGVGTKLVTGYDQPALGGVYKLAAVRSGGGAWQHKIKLSEQAAKISSPGIQQVRRFKLNGQYAGDMIYDLDGPPEPGRLLIDQRDLTRQKPMAAEAQHEDLLVPIFRAGSLVYKNPPIAASRARAEAELGALHEGHKRFLNPHEYPVGLSAALFQRRTALVLQARGAVPLEVPLTDGGPGIRGNLKAGAALPPEKSEGTH